MPPSRLQSANVWRAIIYSLLFRSCSGSWLHHIQLTSENEQRRVALRVSRGIDREGTIERRVQKSPWQDEWSVGKKTRRYERTVLSETCSSPVRFEINATVNSFLDFRGQ